MRRARSASLVAPRWLSAMRNRAVALRLKAVIPPKALRLPKAAVPNQTAFVKIVRPAVTTAVTVVVTVVRAVTVAATVARVTKFN